MTDTRASSLVAETGRPDSAESADRFEAWRTGVQRSTHANTAEFVAARCATESDSAGVDAACSILLEFVSRGKCLRSTFMYLGWLCGAAPSDAALRAASSLELLHAFALLQDDVMDGSGQRRGRPAAHIQFANWHRERGLSGSPRRFGESAAILLGDLCLVWSQQMLRESGLAERYLRRGWPRYDEMRSELAIGQLADLASDARDLPPLEQVLDVARRKSGNYTVRRPLEIGAAMAGCDEATISALGRYGTAVGEAFQLRDDVLGVFGSPATTGKPSGEDLIDRKATSVVMAAYQMANAQTRRELFELMKSDALGGDSVRRWKDLIIVTGAAQWAEEVIEERVLSARADIDRLGSAEPIRAALAHMATFCTGQTQ